LMLRYFPALTRIGIVKNGEAPHNG
jgi:hypothetical protein